MDRLPDEILLMIFRHIDGIRESTRLERVCRRWRKIILDHGWKQIGGIELRNGRYLGPIGDRCGTHLVEIRLSWADIDSPLIRLIANRFPALKHLDFRVSDVTAVEEFRELGPRLRALTFFATSYDPQLNPLLLRDFPHLRHLALNLFDKQNIDSPPNRFPADLRSLYLSSGPKFRERTQVLTMVQRDCPKLAALYLENSIESETVQTQQLMMSRISELKSLRLLRFALSHDFAISELLCSCLNNLPQLLGLQLDISMEQFSAVSRRSPSFFRGLVHLNISLAAYCAGDLELIGLLPTVAPKLRSLNLHVSVHQEELVPEIGWPILKFAQNDTLEFLNVPCTMFSIWEVYELVQLFPNVHSLGVKLSQDWLPEFDDLRQIVVDQWRAGTRKHVPLRLWIHDHFRSSFRYRDPFLTVRILRDEVMPPNPIVDALLRDEVFNNNNEKTPSFVKELYSLKWITS